MTFVKSLTALAVAAALSSAQSPVRAGDALTIYSSARPGAIAPELYRHGGRGQLPGYAMVRHERELQLTRGRNTVRFTDVAALIDPTTVNFESLTDAAGTSVVEQNFQFDLVSTEKLLQKYIDRSISVDQVRGNGVESFDGTLLSTAGGITLRRGDGSIQMLPHNAGMRLPELPGGLITRPTLVWDVAASRAGAHKTRVSYQASGITWWADYNVTYSEGRGANSCQLDVGAWVSIINQSGAGYTDAKLKLDRRRRAEGRDHGAHLSRSVGSARVGRGRPRPGLPGKGVLRISPLHARPPHDAARQLDQADRALPGRAPRALREDSRVLRRAPRLRLRRPIPRSTVTMASRPTARWTSTWASATRSRTTWACRCPPAAYA